MSARPESLAPLLLAHFDRAGRDMPWRRTADPYAIWVSEVMLQQTRVDAVIPFYERWIRQFPDVESLALAEEAAVLRAWEGLGYYSRARNLHAAARVVRERHAGVVPDSAAGLRELPGIGAYTAGAVSSIAYGRAEPAVDGNARRVFSRLLDLDRPTFPALQSIVQPYVPAERPGDFNQAVMELGATICTPTKPRCDECPVQSVCAAYRNDTVALRPGASPQKKVPLIAVASAVITSRDDSDESRVLVVQRPASGLLAGFWEFPAVACAVSRAPRKARELATSFVGCAVPRAQRLEPVRHAFSHRIEMYHPFVFALTQCIDFSDIDPVRDVPARWVSPTALHGLPLPVAQRRIAAAAGLQIPVTNPT